MTGALISLGCAGHLLVDLPVFMGPVLSLVGWLLIATRRTRRRERAETAKLVGPPSASIR